MRICLNMIVKNEAAVITRCLATVKPFVDYWVIVDTGSTDGTQDVVRKFMTGVPGELHERPWKNFAHNRNEALTLARSRGEYVLFIDADESLRMPAGFHWPALSADGYQLRCDYNGWDYLRNALIATRLPWRWEGVLHEFLTCDLPHAWQTLPGPVIHVAHDGARGKNPETYLHDIEVLERAVRDEPTNARYMFYLAQSYRDAGRPCEAMEKYRLRAGMGGWEEEQWFAVYQIALLSEKLGEPAAEIRERYLAAYQLRPSRAEPLCELARYHRLRNEFALAHLYACQAAAIPYPGDALFVDMAVYAWRSLDELAVSAYYVGAQEDGKTALLKLLAENRFPEHERARIEGNRVFYGLQSAGTATDISPPVTAPRVAAQESGAALSC